MQVFRETGAYLKGHFRLTSGLHSNEYLQCAQVLQYPQLAERFGRELAALLPDCDVVVSPAIGGLPIGHEVARAKRARFIFTERDAASGKMTLRRGFSLRPEEKALVIEDVVTTGGTTREVIDLALAAGANGIGSWLYHRSQRRARRPGRASRGASDTGCGGLPARLLPPLPAGRSRGKAWLA